MLYRQNTVSFMRQHRDDFEPFMEDGEDFERYCSRMAQVMTSPLWLIVCRACCEQPAHPQVCGLNTLNCLMESRTAHGQDNRSKLHLHIDTAS